MRCACKKYCIEFRSRMNDRKWKSCAVSVSLTYWVNRLTTSLRATTRQKAPTIEKKYPIWTHLANWNGRAGSQLPIEFTRIHTKVYVFLITIFLICESLPFFVLAAKISWKTKLALSANYSIKKSIERTEVIQLKMVRKGAFRYAYYSKRINLRRKSAQRKKHRFNPR